VLLAGLLARLLVASMDEGDYAADYAERFNKDAIASVVRGAGKTSGQSSDVCLECGEDIPARRKIAIPGCSLCVSCQVEKERLCG
jgi:phage/conjugal plasmid C-4 type zinc finger TraR family protein